MPFLFFRNPTLLCQGQASGGNGGGGQAAMVLLPANARNEKSCSATRRKAQRKGVRRAMW